MALPSKGSRPQGSGEVANTAYQSFNKSTRKKAENTLRRFLRHQGSIAWGHMAAKHQVSCPYGFPSHRQTVYQTQPLPHPRVRSTNNCQQTGVNVITQDPLQASDGSLHPYQPQLASQAEPRSQLLHPPPIPHARSQGRKGFACPIPSLGTRAVGLPEKASTPFHCPGALRICLIEH